MPISCEVPFFSGLSAVLDMMVRDFAEQTHIDVTHDVANVDALLSHDKQIIIYRIFVSFAFCSSSA